MNLLLVASPLLVRDKPVATGGHGADERVGSLELLLLGGDDLGVLLGNMSLKTVRGKCPGDSLLPAGVADVLLPILDPLHPLVDSPLVPVETPGLGEAPGTQPTLVWLLLEMDSGLVPGQMWNSAETQAASGTLNNISIITLFTLN